MSPLGGHFCIKFGRAEEAVTVSAIGGPVYKKSRDNIEKNNILPACCHQALQNPDSIFRTRQSTKKKSGKSAS